jgi:UTP--glucose-1-phosphate uridylyltransferase
MYVLTPPVFTILQEAVDRAMAGQGDVQLTTALQELARRERYLALEVRGVRHDIGSKFGLLQTQLALGLAGKDRDEILALLVELLAESGKA